MISYQYFHCNCVNVWQCFRDVTVTGSSRSIDRYSYLYSAYKSKESLGALVVTVVTLLLCILDVAGGNVASSWSELLQDVWHLVWRSGHARASVCLPELMGTHNALSRHYCHGPRRQQRSRDTAEDRTCSGLLFTTSSAVEFTAVSIHSSS